MNKRKRIHGKKRHPSAFKKEVSKEARKILAKKAGGIAGKLLQGSGGGGITGLIRNIAGMRDDVDNLSKKIEDA